MNPRDTFMAMIDKKKAAAGGGKPAPVAPTKGKVAPAVPKKGAFPAKKGC
jgi:hypothetical protein